MPSQQHSGTLTQYYWGAVIGSLDVMLALKCASPQPGQGSNAEWTSNGLYRK